MRTKTLLLAAALSAAGLATSLAQSNVYSINVVGYYNVPLTNGYNLIANQLDLDGTGTNNTLTSVLGTNFPATTRVYKFNGIAYDFVQFNGTTWGGAALATVTKAMQIGQGFFLFIPNSAALPQTATIVGNVMQGTLSNPVAPGYQIYSSMVPQAGGLTDDLKYQGVATDRAFQWLAWGTPQKYASFKQFNGTTWGPSQPTNAVGESLMLLAHPGSAWVRNFTVQ